MKLNFKEFINETNVPGASLSGGAFVSSDVSGSEQSDTFAMTGRPLHLPSTDLMLPSVLKTSEIINMQEKKNPISIKLKDGTQLYLSWDQFKKIKGRTPQRGRIMSVTFQRRPDDLTDSLSKIIDITIL